MLYVNLCIFVFQFFLPMLCLYFVVVFFYSSSCQKKFYWKIQFDIFSIGFRKIGYIIYPLKLLMKDCSFFLVDDDNDVSSLTMFFQYCFWINININIVMIGYGSIDNSSVVERKNGIISNLCFACCIRQVFVKNVIIQCWNIRNLFDFEILRKMPFCRSTSRARWFFFSPSQKNFHCHLYIYIPSWHVLLLSFSFFS